MKQKAVAMATVFTMFLAMGVTGYGSMESWSTTRAVAARSIIQASDRLLDKTDIPLLTSGTHHMIEKNK